MKPNILFIMTDQQSATMMSCAGNKHLKTPAMDSIAANGVRFERAYCTSPVCVPSRFSLFTGKMPSHINLKDNETKNVYLDKIEALKSQGIGHIMKNTGYEAVYAGKQHLPEFKADDLGFDVLTRDERDVCTDECVGYIKKKKDKPFFLVASLINPHDICLMAIRDFGVSEESRYLIENLKTEISNVNQYLNEAKEGDDDFILANCPELPVNYMPQQDEPGAIHHLISERPFRLGARSNYSEDDWKMHRYVYHKLTEMVDEKIGRLLDALKESGQEENTVIIFTSDHGDMDSAHKLEHKTVFYEEASRVPLLISHKGHIPTGVMNSTHLISNGLDLIPTICDYAEAEVPQNLEGRSFRPIAEGKVEVDWRKAIYLESELGRMVVTDQYKYAKFYMGDHDEQLYDLRNDPFETKNSAFLEENKVALGEHRDLLSGSK